MKKYYVTCGEINFVCISKSSHEAIFKALDLCAGNGKNKLSHIIRVSEIGHEEHKEDELFLLSDMFMMWIKGKNGLSK